MDFDTLIDEELLALSDCDAESNASLEEVEYDEDLLPTANDEPDWLKLFLEKTSQQTSKTEALLSDAQDVLNEIADNNSKSQLLDSLVQTVAPTDGTEQEMEIGDATDSVQDHEDDVKNENSESSSVEKDLEISEVKDFRTMESRLSCITESFENHKHESEKRLLDVEESFKKEVAMRMDDIECQRLASHSHLALLEDEERNILLELNRQKLFYKQERDSKAAVLIQAFFRGYIVRKQYGDILKQKCKKVKEAKVEEVQNVGTLPERNHHDQEHLSDTDFDNTTRVGLSSDVAVANDMETVSRQSDNSSTRSSLVDSPHTDAAGEGAECSNDLETRENENSVSSSNEQQETETTSDGLVITSQQHGDSPGHRPIYLQNETVPDVEETGNISARTSIMDAINKDLEILASSAESGVNEATNCSLKQDSDFAHVIGNSHSDDDVTSGGDIEQKEPSIGESHHQKSNNILFELDNDLALLGKSFVLDDNKHNDSRQSGMKHVDSPCAESEPKSEIEVVAVEKSLEVGGDHGQPNVSLSVASTDMNARSTISERQRGQLADESGLSGSSAERAEEGPQPDETEKYSSTNQSLATNMTVSDSSTSATPSHALVTPSISYTETNCESQSDRCLNDSDQHSRNEQSCPSPANNSFNVERPSSADESFAVSPQRLGASSVESVPDLSVAEIPYCEDISVTEKPIVDVETKVPLDLEHTFPRQPTPPRRSRNDDVPTKRDEMLIRSPLMDNITSQATRAPLTDRLSDQPTKSDTNEICATEADAECNEAVTLVTSSLRQNDVSIPDNGKLQSQERGTAQTILNVITSEADNSPQATSASDSHTTVSSPRSQNLGSGGAINQQSPDKPVLLYSTLESLDHWRKRCVRWNETPCDVTMTHPTVLRRGVRKSSAAKRLPSLTEEELVNGLWPNFKDEERRLGTLSRIYINRKEGTGSNLVQVQRCTSLTHLSLHGCGLVSVEGLQACPSLRHIDVSQNRINLISCGGLARLESLIATHNCLTSIHGLDGCTSLLHLDLSHNNVTRINGLQGLPNLRHLRIAHNSLIHMTGLKTVSSLLILDVSGNHLSSLAGIENCALIRCLNAKNNSLPVFDANELTNAVLLTQLNLSDNNIETINLSLSENSAPVWLPSLHSIALKRNKVTLNDACSFSGIPLLCELDLRQNLITNSDKLMSALVHNRCLSLANVDENPLPDKEEALVELRQMSSLNFRVSTVDVPQMQSKFCGRVSDLIGFEASDVPDQMPASDPALQAILRQVREFVRLVNDETKAVKALRGWKNFSGRKSDSISATESIDTPPPDLAPVHCDWLKKFADISARQRYWFESGYVAKNASDVQRPAVTSGDLSSPPRPAVTFEQPAVTPGVLPSPPRPAVTFERPEVTSDDLSEVRDLFAPSKSRKPRDLRQARDIDDVIIQKFDRRKLEKPLSAEELLTSSRENHPESRIASQTSSLIGDLDMSKEGKPHAELRSCTNTKVVYERLKRRNVSKEQESFAATKIQAFWRMSLAKRKFAYKLDRRKRAVSTLQAAWRGYVVRRNIKSAMQSFNNSADFDMDNFDEVDLEELNFDEVSYDKQWALRTDLGKIFSSTLGGRNSADIPPSPVARHVDNATPIHPRHRLPDHDRMAKPPLPPISPSGFKSARAETDASCASATDSYVTQDTHRSKLSSKEEQMANEWGLHSDLTRELMLKRARKMKGRRRKDVSAVVKLKKFQEVAQNFSTHPLPAQPKQSHSRRKVEYFKAREMLFEQKDKIPSEDDKQRQQYTYEWLHTSANIDAFNGRDARPAPSHRSSDRSRESTAKPVFLPAIPARRSLVSSPYQAGDTEVLSVSSYNTERSRSKHLLRDIARRHADS